MEKSGSLADRFFKYEQLGLIDNNELHDLLKHIPRQNPAPVWLVEFADVCARAANGQMGRRQFEGVKDRFFQNMRSPQDRIIHQKPIRVHPVGVSDETEAESRQLVKTCAIIAGLIGLVPLPVADAPFIIVTQFVMLKKLCARYQRSPGITFVLILLSAILGPILFDIFIKLIPFAGSVIGALVAGGLTWVIGSKVMFMLENAQDFNWENFWRAKISSK